MRIIALYDSNGSILAAAETQLGVSGPVPAADKDTEVEIFDVPDSCRTLRLDEICKSLRVDCRTKRLIEAGEMDSTTGR